MNRSTSDTIGQVRDVLNVVVAPSSPVVLRSVLGTLWSLDRDYWYASLLIEGDDDSPDRLALAQAARGFGVPVMTVRTAKGPNRVSHLRMFLDEWFLVRNSYAAIVHVHSPATLKWSKPLNWVRLVMPRFTFVVSVYSAGVGENGVARADIVVRGRRARIMTRDRVQGSPATTSGLYKAALSDSILERSAS